MAIFGVAYRKMPLHWCDSPQPALLINTAAEEVTRRQYFVRKGSKLFFVCLAFRFGVDFCLFFGWYRHFFRRRLGVVLSRYR